MTCVIKILQIIDQFFHKDSLDFSTYDNESTQPYLNKVNQLIGENINNASLDSITLSDFIQNTQKKVHENVNAVLDNLDMIFYLTPMFEKKLYEKVNPILQQLSERYPNKFIASVNWLLAKHGLLSNFTNETESIMIIHDELMAIGSTIENLTLKELNTFPDRTISKIIKLNFIQYELYFKDWMLKFASLMEDKFKNIMIFLYYFQMVENQQITSLSKLRNKMLGEIHTRLNVIKKYPNIDKFRVYRNKAFHKKGVKFLYDQNVENRLIIVSETLKLKISDFLLDFDKLLRFINTFITLAKIVGINIKINGRSAIDRYRGQI